MWRGGTVLAPGKHLGVGSFCPFAFPFWPCPLPRQASNARTMAEAWGESGGRGLWDGLGRLDTAAAAAQAAFHMSRRMATRREGHGLSGKTSGNFVFLWFFLVYCIRGRLKKVLGGVGIGTREGKGGEADSKQLGQGWQKRTCIGNRFQLATTAATTTGGWRSGNFVVMSFFIPIVRLSWHDGPASRLSGLLCTGRNAHHNGLIRDTLMGDATRMRSSCMFTRVAVCECEGTPMGAIRQCSDGHGHGGDGDGDGDNDNDNEEGGGRGV